MTEDKRKELWQQYSENKTSELRGKLIIEYLDIVKIKAKKLYVDLNFKVEYDDLFSSGVFGLIDAIDKFDLKRDIKFETYANTRVYGAIIDYVRKTNWKPRTVISKQNSLEKTITKIRTEKNREPTDEEIAKELNITLSKLKKWYTQVNVNLTSLDELIEKRNTDALSLSDNVHPEDIFIKIETKELLYKAISKLTEKQRTVIVLYYFKGLTDTDISKILKVTVSNVTAMRIRALRKLKSCLEKYICI